MKERTKTLRLEDIMCCCGSCEYMTHEDTDGYGLCYAKSEEEPATCHCSDVCHKYRER